MYSTCWWDIGQCSHLSIWMSTAVDCHSKGPQKQIESNLWLGEELCPHSRSTVPTNLWRSTRCCGEALGLDLVQTYHWRDALASVLVCAGTPDMASKTHHWKFSDILHPPLCNLNFQIDHLWERIRSRVCLLRLPKWHLSLEPPGASGKRNSHYVLSTERRASRKSWCTRKTAAPEGLGCDWQRIGSRYIGHSQQVATGSLHRSKPLVQKCHRQTLERCATVVCELLGYLHSQLE